MYLLLARQPIKFELTKIKPSISSTRPFCIIVCGEDRETKIMIDEKLKASTWTVK